MTKLLILAVSLTATIVSVPLLGGDLSSYRQFDLESSLIEIAGKVDTNPQEALTVHQRPALIQELSWRPGYEDAVKEIRFTFYEGELFRMMVSYDRYRTEGVTEADVVGAISTIYGEPGRPTDQVSFPSIYGEDEAVDVIARWEDPAWSYNLIQFRGGQPFTLAVFSKSLDSQAQAAIETARRLDKEEAPQRKIDQKRIDDAETAAELEATRLLNKPRFQP